MNKWDLRGRLRSKAAWAAVAGLVMIILSVFNVWSKIGITMDGFREIMAAIGAVLDAFGIFNDPTSPDRF